MKERHLHTTTLMGTSEIQCEALKRTECIRASVCASGEQDKNGRSKKKRKSRLSVDYNHMRFITTSPPAQVSPPYRIDRKNK